MRKLLVVLLAAAACGGQTPTTGATAANVRYGTRVHRMPRRASAPSTGPSGAKLVYYGGHVISNVKIIQVLWGQGSYASEISGASMGNFYREATGGSYFDWLSEYNTTISAANGQPGTNQTIGRGSFEGQLTITPSTSGNTIDDTAIQSELAAQINAGNLPAPDADTLYMVNFPKGVSITQGGSNSCQSGGFCAYHGTFTRNGASVYYGVLPDMSAGAGCDTGCGGDPLPFNNQTSVASHELVEAVTDAEVGLATTNGPPLAWYDQTNGEIGDICNAQQGTFVGSDGVTYTVQQEWSNAQNACVDHGAGSTPPPPPPAGCTTDSDCGNGQVCVSGTCQNPTPPPPAGCTSDSDCDAGQVCVSGVCQAPAPAGDLITNGDFETGDLSGWSTSGTALATDLASHGGTYSAQVGDTSAGADSAITQTVQVPANGATLGFWVQGNCNDTVQNDWASASLYDTGGNQLASILDPVCANDGSWQQVTFDLTPYAGQTVVVSLENHDDGNTNDPSWTLFDDVTVQ